MKPIGARRAALITAIPGAYVHSLRSPECALEFPVSTNGEGCNLELWTSGRLVGALEGPWGADGCRFNGYGRISDKKLVGGGNT